MTNSKRAIITGGIIAFAGSVLMLILLALGLVGPRAIANDLLMYGGTILFISLYVFLLIGIFYVLKKRKQANGNKLSIKQALTTGAITSLATAIFSVFCTIIFYELLYPSYHAELTQVLETKLQEGTASQASILQKIEEQTKYYSTSMQAMFSFVGNFISGLAFSFLLALFLKSK